MKKKLLIIFFLVLGVCQIKAQVNPYVLYKNGVNKLGFVFAENFITQPGPVTTDGPYEGADHLKFDYNVQGWWAGGAFDINNWDNETVDVTAYTHLSIAWKSTNGAAGSKFAITFVDETGEASYMVEFGRGDNSTYQTELLSLADLFKKDSLIDFSKLKLMRFRVLPPAVETATGQFYIDAIEFVETTVIPPPPPNPDTLIIYKGTVNKLQFIFAENFVTQPGPVTTDGPLEGTDHLKFNYNSIDWWAGGGFNLNNWDNEVIDVTNMTHLSISWKSTNGAPLSKFTITFLDDQDEGGYEITVGTHGNRPNYQTAYFPLLDSIKRDSAINLAALKTMRFRAYPPGVPAGTGQFYIDAIEFINSPTAAVYDQKISFNSSMIPNPSSSGIFQINSEEQITEVVVMDLNGRVVFSSQNNSNSFDIDLSNSPSGIYVATLIAGEKRTITRIVKE